MIYINNRDNRRPPVRSYNNPPPNINSYAQVRRTARYRPAAKRPSGFIKYLSRFVLFLIFTAVIFAVFTGLFFLNLTRTSSPSDFNYTLEIIIYNGDTHESEITQVIIDAKTGFINNARYFPINKIMESMGFFLAGDDSEPSFIRRSPEENLKLEIGSNISYVNGTKHHLTAPSFIRADIIYMPVDFLINAFNNISLADNNMLVEINPHEPYFKIHALAALAPIDENSPDNAVFLAQHGSLTASFIADLSEYTQYFNPPQEHISEYIKLINQTNPLGADYLPPDLTDLIDTRADRETNQARLYAAKAAEAMLIEARAHGHTQISITSGYRSYASQTSLFNHNAAQLEPVHGLQEAERLTALAIAYPGQSEHQSGLAIDMHSIPSGAAQSFGSQPDGIWLAENAHNFGFILRYPDGKTDITGIQYEPWHFRYVGRYHAARIYASGLTLEEYHEQILS